MISEEIKNQIIYLFENTRNKPFDIFNIVNKNNNIPIEEFYTFLNTYKTKDGKALKRDIKSINKKIDIKIYQLRLKGLSPQEIADKLNEEYIQLKPSSISTRCKNIFKEKGEEPPAITTPKKTTKKNKKKKEKKPKIKKVKSTLYNCNNKQRLIDKNELYELRSSGLSLEKITNHFKEKGIDISSETIRKMCKKIYEEKGEKEPRYESLGNRYDEIASKALKMREMGLSYKDIKEEFAKQGVEVCSGKIKKICNESGKDIKFIGKTKRQVDDEKIYNLRKQGMSLRETTKSFQESGIEVSYSYIAMNSSRVFKEKGEKLPKSVSAKLKSLDNLNQEIYKLRKEGYTFYGIKSYLEEQGINVGITTIRSRCDIVFKERGEEVPRITKYNSIYKKEKKSSYRELDNKKIIDAVIEIGKRRKATEEQMKIFMNEVAQKYKINLEPEEYER